MSTTQPVIGLAIQSVGPWICTWAYSILIRLFIFRMIALLQQCSVFLFGIPPAGWGGVQAKLANCWCAVRCPTWMANATCRGSFRRFQKHRSAMHHQQCVSLTLPIAFDYALLMCFLGWFLHIHKHEHKNVSSLSRRLSLSTVTVVVIPIITTTIILTYSYYHCAILCLIGSFYLSLFRLTPAQETGKKKALHLPRPALVWRIRTGADKFGSKKWGIQRGIPVITGIPMKIVIAHHSPWNSSCIPQTYASNAISMGKWW